MSDRATYPRSFKKGGLQQYEDQTIEHENETTEYENQCGRPTLTALADHHQDDG